MPACFKSNPSPQDQAEHDCATCPVNLDFLKGSPYITYLSPKDYDAFLDALDNPKPPSEALKRLMREHRATGGQSRSKSLIETVTSTVIGFVVSLVLTATVMPAFGYQTTWSHDFWITVIFTVASIARGYFVRRSFETGLWRRWIRS